MSRDLASKSLLSCSTNRHGAGMVPGTDAASGSGSPTSPSRLRSWPRACANASGVIYRSQLLPASFWILMFQCDPSMRKSFCKPAVLAESLRISAKPTPSIDLLRLPTSDRAWLRNNTKSPTYSHKSYVRVFMLQRYGTRTAGQIGGAGTCAEDPFDEASNPA